GGADFKHLVVNDALYVFRKDGVLVRIVHLNPSAPGTWPGKLLGNSLHGDPAYAVDNVSQGHRLFAVIGQIDVDLIAYNKKVVLPCDGHDFNQHFARIDRAGGVIGIDDQNAGDRGIVLHLHPEVVQIRVPEIVGVKPVGNVL